MGERGAGWLHPGLCGGERWTTKGIWLILGENQAVNGVPAWFCDTMD